MASQNGKGDDWGRVERLERTGKQGGRPALPPGVSTPEQGCIGCLSGIGMLLLAVLFWAYIYWRNEANFHPEWTATPTPAPTATPNLNHPKPGFTPSRP